ncbi:class I SAM-dependent methyltransferase [Pseudomonas soli]|uniref:class I SAM-dependent methyltransferase n=1 Tax=Pseudomonas soli TaxID=1306993 RepID=UPI00068E5B14
MAAEVKVDLGCGKRKQQDFIGVDRFPMPEVDVIADLDGVLPFPDSSVDLLFSSHALEHVGDLMMTMREIYRVCKHGAQVCIVAPYYEQKLNLANPYHIGVFNEHTPRFWTDHPHVPVAREDFPDPVPRPWGLSRSDNSSPGLDIRLANMEFFYFPKYRFLPVEEQRLLRSQRLDVCEQIIYQLIVWKEEAAVTGPSYEELLAHFVPYEPNYIKQMKMQEREELIRKHTLERDHLLGQISQLEAATEPSAMVVPGVDEERRVSELLADREYFERLLQDARGESQQLRSQLNRLFERLEAQGDQMSDLTQRLIAAESGRAETAESVISLANEHVVVCRENDELHKRVAQIELKDTHIALLKADLDTANGLVEWFRAKETSWVQKQVNPVAPQSPHLDNQLQALKRSIELQQEEARRVVSDLYGQLSSYRGSTSVGLIHRLRREDGLWNSVTPAFQEIKAFTAKMLRKRRSQLILGEDLRCAPYREYLMPMTLDSMTAVTLAISPLLRPEQGLVGIEIVNAQQEVIAQSLLPLSSIDTNAPTTFVLAQPLTNLQRNWMLRVFVREATVPVGLYEMARFSIFRRVTTLTPFVALK